MDGSFDKVDDLKAEIEKLKEVCSTKEELFKSLKRANSELLLESKGAKTLIEQKSKELDAKTEELSEVRQMCENLNSSLKEKDLSVKHLNFVNGKLRTEYSEKIKFLEEQNKGLIVALDEATLRIQDCDGKLCAGNKEIQGLKRLLATAEKKCLEAEEKTKASKELKCRDNIIIEVEEENRSVKDQLKWKSEQFEHLEQAHELLQNQSHQSKVKWEKEKSDLLKDLLLLKTNLDSQIEISEDLQRQLKMCNQALSHEESKRRILEIEVVELKSHFDNVALEFEEAKAKIENLTLLRDEDVADLRCELGTKEALNKEMKYKIAHLELENDELQGLLKECREEQIKIAGGGPVKKLQNKLRSLEKLHSQCSVNLDKKEVEWNSRYEKMLEVVNGNMSDLRNKDVEIQDMRKKLECCSYLMEFQNQDEKIMLSEIAEMRLDNKEFGGLSDDRSANPKENNGISEELLKCQVRLKEKFEEMETTLKRSSGGIVYALEIANCKLAKKVNEVNQTRLELQERKFNAEMVKSHFEETHGILKREKDSLVGLVKEQDVQIGKLQDQVALFDANIAAKMEEINALEQEKKHYYQIVENYDSNIKELKSEIALLKQESAEKEREGSTQACLNSQLIAKQEEERFLKLIKEQDQTIEDLQRWIILIEQDFENQLMCSFSAITEKDIQLDLLIEAEKLKQLEIQDKNQEFGELEKRKHDLCQEVSFLKESLLHSSSQVVELTAELEAQKWETEQGKNQCSSKQVQVLELQSEKESLQREKENLLREVMSMCSQREDMIAQMEAAHDWIRDLSRKDSELTNTLEDILQNTENSLGQAIISICDEVVQTRLSPSTKSEREKSNQRLPLKVLND